MQYHNLRPIKCCTRYQDMISSAWVVCKFALFQSFEFSLSRHCLESTSRPAINLLRRISSKLPAEEVGRVCGQDFQDLGVDAQFSLIPKSAAVGCPCLGWSANPLFVAVFAFVFAFGFVLVLVLFSLLSYALMMWKRHHKKPSCWYGWPFSKLKWPLFILYQFGRSDKIAIIVSKYLGTSLSFTVFMSFEFFGTSLFYSIHILCITALLFTMEG